MRFAGLFLAAALAGGCAQHEIVGYYAGWKGETVFHPGEVTVVNYAFAYVGADGAMLLEGGAAEDGTFAKLRALKEHDRALRLMVSVGGWTRSDGFSDMVGDAAMRARFVHSAVLFLRTQGFDGIDIDWEYPGDIGHPCPSGRTCQRADDKRNFVALARELRSALDAAGIAEGRRYFATIAAGADEKFILESGRPSPWLAELAESLDWVNLMSYDYHGSWERVAGLNAPLHADPVDPVGSHVEEGVKRLLASGIPARKLTLGIPFYGKGWSGCMPGPSGDGLHQPCAGLASGSANESFDFSFLTDQGYLLPDHSGRYTIAGRGFVRHWDARAAVPWLYNASNGTFITYDDEASVEAKAALVRQYGLRGAMFWELGADRHGVLRGVLRRSLP